MRRVQQAPDRHRRRTRALLGQVGTQRLLRVLTLFACVLSGSPINVTTWMDVVQGLAGRVTCVNMTSMSTEGKRQGNDWELCLDDWEPVQSCLVFSVGIGDAWQFDDALATQLGCEVHSFDPTQQLRAQHEAHDVRGVHFHYTGLGKMRPNAYGTQGRGAAMLPLGAMMARWAGKRTVDVLKIDCEGCEWEAIRHVARNQPSLLRRVRLVLIELHITSQLAGRGVLRSIVAFAEHVFEQHGFRVYRHRTNLGKVRDRWRASREVRDAGLDPEPCCYELHLMREVATEPPSAEPWRRVPTARNRPISAAQTTCCIWKTVRGQPRAETLRGPPWLGRAARKFCCFGDQNRPISYKDCGARAGRRIPEARATRA